MIKQRILTALVLAPLALAAVFLLPLAAFSLVMALVVAIGGWEWSNFLSRRKSVRFGYLLSVILITLGLYLNYDDLSLSVIFAAGIFWLFALVNVLRYPNVSLIDSVWSKALIGFCVLLPAWVAMIGLRSSTEGGLLIALLFSLVWGADIGAYFAGKRFGRQKLLPSVSPGKTLEGLAGGLSTCVLIALGFSIALGLSMGPTLSLIVLSIVTGLVSVLGDLFESLFKRERGIKDSGSILPGHGGVLDRIDSLTAAAPVFFLGVSLTQIF